MAKVLIVGAGAAGLMAAGAAVRQGHQVTVLEHMDKPGQKILVTGKGRCNVTNDCPAEEFLRHVRTNPRFLFSSLGSFPPAKTMELFESLGVELKVERGRRVFPVSDKAEEIRQALLRYAQDAELVHDGAKKLLLEEVTPEPEAEPEPAVPAGMNPLTGLPMEPEYERNRPVAVMLNNLKKAQPQLGNSQADIIYEVPAEGGITRMLAVYQTLDGIGTLGSIRSSRPYYIELALGHDALYVHAGGSPEAYQDLKSWKVNNIDGVNGSASQSAVFWRDQERRKTMDYEHTLVTSGEKIQSFWDSSKYAKTHGDGYTYSQTFTDEPLTGGATAEHVKLAYTSYKTGLFDYDAATGKYLVSQYQAPYVDGNTGEQVSAVNLLLLETNISVISGDKEGRLKVRTTGEGDGLLCRNGQSVPIHWSRADRNSPFAYTTADGQPLALGRGNSYVCIMDPKTSKVDVLLVN